MPLSRGQQRQAYLTFNVAGASWGQEIVEHTAEDWDFTVNSMLEEPPFYLKHEARQMPERPVFTLLARRSALRTQNQ